MKTYFDGTAALEMPRNFVVINSEEMEYLSGGETITMVESLGAVRTRLDNIIASSIVCNLSLVVLGACIGGILGAAIGFLAGSAFFGPITNYARSAHNQVENLIRSYGTGRLATFRSTWSNTVFCTGMSVTV